MKVLKILLLISLLYIPLENIFCQANGDYRTLYINGGNHNWNTAANWQIYNGTTWTTATVVPPSSNEVITIQAGSFYTLNVNFNVAYKLVIRNGGALTIGSTYTLTAGSGNDTIINSGTLTPTGTLSFLSGSVYEHAQNGGNIPTATWATTSTCYINYTSGTMTTAPTGATGQTFGNFTWNADVPTGSLDFTGLGTITGNFLVSATGNTGVYGNTLRLQSALNVSGNFTTSGNTSLNLNNTASARTFNIGGNFNAGGNYFLSNGSGLTTINLNGSGNTITETTTDFLDFNLGPTNSNVTFHITNGASYSMNSNMSVPGANSLTIDNGGTLYAGTDIINNNRSGESASGGVFTVSSGGTLGIGSAQGITSVTVCGAGSGNIQTCTTNYNTGANYIYDGTTNQVTGSGLTQNIPANITINNTGNIVSLSASTTLSSQLILTNGGLNLNSFTLYVNNPATTAIVRDGITYLGYIVSNSLDQNFTNILKWNIGTTTGDHIFPFGVDAATYIPFTFNLSAGGSSGNVQVSTYPDPGTTAATVFSDRPTIVTNLASINNPTVPSSNAANIVRRFWMITPDINPITGGAANITFTYGSDALEAPLTGEEANSMEAQHYATSTNTWDFPFLPSQTSNTSSNTVSVPAVTTFSPWAITQSSDPLPIKLLAFNAVCTGNKVDLDWATASETNNDYFTVEKSIDGVDWEFVLNMNGAGNSNNILYYKTSDDQPFAGNSYYRLKQTDFNGAFTYSNIAAVDCITNQAFKFESAYYSTTANEIILLFNATAGDHYTYSLMNLTGQQLHSTSGMATAGTNEFHINANGLSPGHIPCIIAKQRKYS